MQRSSRARSGIPLIWTGFTEGPLKGTGSSKVLDALSCYLRLILKHSDLKLNKKKLIKRGGACLLRPPLDPPLYMPATL